MLAGSGLSDDSTLAHSLGQQSLTEVGDVTAQVVMGPGSGEVWQVTGPGGVQDVKPGAGERLQELIAVVVVAQAEVQRQAGLAQGLDQVNERLVLKSSEVQHQFVANRVTLLKADWTQYDPEITKQLAAVNRSGVPTYVLYPASPQAMADVLPELLTKDIVLDAMRKDLH